MKGFLGELLGTAILVFFGCGSVAIAVTYDGLELFQIAFVWCLAVTFGIFASRKYCPAHLNPAVSFAMLLAKKCSFKEFTQYITGQFTGAFIAGLLLFVLFNSSLLTSELTHDITRGSEQSIQTAKVFGEYYGTGNVSISTPLAFFAEAFGTFVLVLLIFRLTSKENEHAYLTPFYIGLTVAMLICIIAPITQCGINPARDFSPRLVSYLLGWGSVVFTTNGIGWFVVYIAAPMCGAALAFVTNNLITRND